jgi:hypothetical protein
VKAFLYRACALGLEHFPEFEGVSLVFAELREAYSSACTDGAEAWTFAFSLESALTLLQNSDDFCCEVTKKGVEILKQATFEQFSYDHYLKQIWCNSANLRKPSAIDAIIEEAQNLPDVENRQNVLYCVGSATQQEEFWGEASDVDLEHAGWEKKHITEAFGSSLRKGKLQVKIQPCSLDLKAASRCHTKVYSSVFICGNKELLEEIRKGVHVSFF